MTRERAKELAPIIAAYAEGRDIQHKAIDSFWDDTIEPSWSCNLAYRIKPESRTRPMTRGEVLYMVTTTPAMVVRQTGEVAIPAQRLMYQERLENYEYAIIDKSGNPIDGWHKFEVVE